jgi:hypothetical protein
MANCKDCSETICNTCNDDYYLKSNICEKCDVACELKCNGDGPKNCVKCKEIGY